MHLNSENVANTQKYWTARPDRAEIFNNFWYWLVLRNFALVNPTLLLSYFNRNKSIHPKMVMERKCPVLISIGHISQQ